MPTFFGVKLQNKLFCNAINSKITIKNNDLNSFIPKKENNNNNKTDFNRIHLNAFKTFYSSRFCC